MLKRYCDACGKEITSNRQAFNPLIHLVETDRGQYVDNEHNVISGVRYEYDLCMKCYNRVMGKAVSEFKAIIKEMEEV